MKVQQPQSMGCFLKGCINLALHSVWVILGALGLYYAINSAVLATRGVEVDSIMVDIDINSNNREGSTSYSPIYEYTYNGQTYRYNSVNSSSSLPHEIGDHVTLVIDPKNPENARVNSFSELWMLPSILLPISLCLGIFMIFLGVIISKYGKVTSMGSISINP